MRTALVMLASPLHATLAAQLLETERIVDYDVIYLSSENSAEDRLYFERIALGSRVAHYFHVPSRSSGFQILVSLWVINRARLRSDYSYSVFASLTSIPIVKTAIKRAPIFLTLDEGVANLNTGSRLYKDSRAWNARLYRAIFLVPGLSSLKVKILRHYTVHPEFQNIVEEDKLAPLQGWNNQLPASGSNKDCKTYFIGTEIDKYFNPDLNRLAEFLMSHPLDFYVAHPRETRPLDLGAPVLKKCGLIAEEAIIKDAAGAGIHLIGWPSTVLFNLNFVEKRTAIFPESGTNVLHLVDVALRSGCEVVFI